MRSLLRRLHRVPKTFQDSNTAATSENSPPCPSGRQNKFRLSTRAGVGEIPHKAFVPAIKLVYESPVPPARSRKRDRLKNYLSRRRKSNAKGPLTYWPAILSTDKEETRSSDDTEDGDDVYMVDFESDSDSDDESMFQDDFVTPPVIIPEMYRRQDRLGGITVAGARVVFTIAGFKRQQMVLGKLQSVPESDPLDCPMGLHHEYVVIGAY